MSQILKITKKEELIKPLISDPLDEEKWIQNEQILRELEAEEARLKAAYGIAGFLTVAPIVTPLTSIISIPAVVAAGITAEYLTRANRIYRITKMLLERFGEEGITITLRVQTTAGLIDLFVKMPDKRNFALVLRSNAICSVRWRADKQEFMVYKPGRSNKKWTGLTQTARELSSTMELKKAKSLLLGTSRAERDRAIVKTIVLCGKTTIHTAHANDFKDFGQTQALALKMQENISVMVVEEENLIKFLMPSAK